MSETTPTGPAGPSSERGVMIVLAYLWPLALVPLLVEKNDQEVLWHARHGIVLMAADIVVLIVYFVLQLIVGILTGGVGCLLLIIVLPLLFLAIVALHAAAIIKGLNGQRLLIPVLSDYADKF
jgi:uncharacterized membrane protein